MIIGYHTAGLLLHDERTAIEELSRIGYRCVAIRPRRGTFDPLAADFSTQIVKVVAAVKSTGVSVVLDANSPFLHDIDRADMPSLASRDAGQRSQAVRWLRRLIDVAGEIGECEIVFSVTPCPVVPVSETAESLDRLAEQLVPVLEYAQKHDITMSLRPANGTLIANLAQYERFMQWLHADHPLKLAADVGEMLSSGELPLADRLSRGADMLRCVLLCDLHHGAAGDCRIGHGDVNLSRIMTSLAEQSFSGKAIVRVQGHEKHGFFVAKEAFKILWRP